MRAVVATAVLALSLAEAASAVAAAPPPHRADGDLRDWRGTPTSLAGRSTTSRGELVYTDWLYDDYGPDLNGRNDTPPAGGTGTQTKGDYRYPSDPDRYGHNAADLRELRIAADRKNLYLLIAFQTMLQRDAAMATVALDGDESSAGEWPDGAGIATPGPDRFVTTWGTGARLTTPRGSVPVRAHANLAENAIEVKVSLRALGGLPRRPRVWVVTGLNDGGRFARQRDGQTAAFNAGFRANEQIPSTDVSDEGLMSAWGENSQAAALARRDVSEFAGAFDLRRLQKRRSDPPRPLAPGYYNRIYRSTRDFGEGIVVGGSPAAADAVFRSPHQPYGMYVPRGYSAGSRPSMTMYLHPFGVNHTVWPQTGPNMFRQLGDERGAVVILPLGRGFGTVWYDAGLVDAIEASDDAAAAVGADPDRISLIGYSQGGFGTYRIGFLMPDRFARVNAQAAFTHVPTVPGDTRLQVENATNLPVQIMHSNTDEIPVAMAQEQADLLDAAGATYRFVRLAAGEHFTDSLRDEFDHEQRWLGTFRRDRDPVHVVFRRFPERDLPARRLAFDSAYWVRGVAARSAPGPDDFARVEAFSYARGVGRPGVLDLPPETFTGPSVPGTITGQDRVPGGAAATQNAFEADLRNVARVAFDVRRMGLARHRPVDLRVVSDGPVVVTLAGRFRQRIAARSGAGPLAVAQDGAGVRLELPAGTSDVRLTPKRRRPR